MKAVYHLTENDIKDAIKTWMQSKQITGRFEVTLIITDSASTGTHVTATVSQADSKNYLD